MTTQQTSRHETHHFILTLQIPANDGAQMATFSNAITPPDGMNRAELYKALREQISRDNPHLAHANTVFFSLERNEL